MDLAGRIIEYLQGLRVTQGHDLGDNFTVLPWQAKLIRGVWGRSTISEAAISLPRGQGKSTLMGGIMAAAVDPKGPLHMHRAENITVAASLRQARIGQGHCRAFLEDKYGKLGRAEWQNVDSTNQCKIAWKATGASAESVAANARTLQGLGAARLILCDEVGDWNPNISEALQAALWTGLGKVPGSRIVAIGVRPGDDSNWFARMLSEPARGRYRLTYSVPRGTPPEVLLQKTTWLKANPSARHWPTLARAIAKDAADAKRDSRKLAHFRSRRANQGTCDIERSHLIEPDVWDEAGKSPPDRDGSPVIAFDIGGSRSGSACVAAWPRTGRAEALQLFPNIPNLSDRERRDSAPEGLYDAALARGDLMLGGRRSPDIPALVAEAIERFGQPAACVADNWKQKHLEDALEECDAEAEIIVRRMGPYDGSQDADAARHLLGEGELFPVRSNLWDWSMSRSICTTDTNGNVFLQKHAGDDLGVATCLAAGVLRRDGSRLIEPPRVFSIAV